MDPHIFNSIIQHYYNSKQYNTLQIKFHTSNFKIYKFEHQNIINTYGSLCKYKFHILKNFINKHYFIINPKIYEPIIFNTFCLYQKFLFSINKFKLLYKIKYKFKKYNCDTDLSLTPFKNIKQQYIISLIEQNTIYKFSVLDLIKVFKTALYTSKYLIVKTKLPCNPYTNIPFSIHNLFNIYYHIIFKTNIILPYYIHSFFQNNANITLFKINNEYTLKFNSVIEYIDSEVPNVLINDIVDMFEFISSFYKSFYVNFNYLIPSNFSIIYNKCKNMFTFFMLLQLYNSTDNHYHYILKLFKEQFNFFKTKFPHFSKKRISFYSSFDKNNRTLLFQHYIK